MDGISIVDEVADDAECSQLIALHPGKRDGAGNVHYLPLTGGPPPVDGIVARMAALIPERTTRDTVLLSAIWPGPFVHTEHADNVLRDGRPNHTPQRNWTGLLYLSQPNGGRLVFGDLGIEVQPKPGLLVIMPAHLFHHTTPVEPGPVRYSLNCWFR